MTFSLSPMLGSLSVPKNKNIEAAPFVAVPYKRESVGRSVGLTSLLPSDYSERHDPPESRRVFNGDAASSAGHEVFTALKWVVG